MVRSSNNSDRTLHCTATQPVIKVMRGQNHERKRQFGMGIRGGGLWLRPTLAIVLLLSCAVGRSYAADMAYCSSSNTGSSSTPMTNIYQSNGLCTNYCQADYAFAIVQGSKCWCSNYIPATTTTGCDSPCPGYGYETCGSTTKGVFGYIALDNVSPSGTASASSTVRTTTNPPDTSTSSIDTTSSPPPLSISTVVEAGPTKTLIITTTPTPTSTSTSTTSTSTSTTSTTSSSTSTSTTTTQSLSPSVTVVTSVGGVRTVTYIPESTGSATATPVASSSDGGFFSQPGRVAGVFVGVALLVIAIVGALLFFCYRRNRQRRSMRGGPEAAVIPAGGAGIMAGRRRSRSLSTLGLMGEKGFHSVDTAPSTGPPNMAGLNGVANGVERGPDGTKLVDQRLDPSQLYLRYDPDTGSSRMSVRSLRDDADYSRRVLRLANPDD